MFEKFYGFFAIGFIELGNLFTNISNLLTIFIVLLQVIIAIFTIVKLYKDIKSKKYKSLEQTEKELQKKKPFLFAMFELIKKIKL